MTSKGISGTYCSWKKFRRSPVEMVKYPIIYIYIYLFTSVFSTIQTVVGCLGFLNHQPYVHVGFNFKIQTTYCAAHPSGATGLDQRCIWLLNLRGFMFHLGIWLLEHQTSWLLWFTGWWVIRLIDYARNGWYQDICKEMWWILPWFCKTPT